MSEPSASEICARFRGMYVPAISDAMYELGLCARGRNPGPNDAMHKDGAAQAAMIYALAALDYLTSRTDGTR